MFINKNKLSYTLLTLSVLFLFFIIFKSEFIFSGEKRSYYKTYYQISFVLILISFLSLFLSMKLKIYFNIIFVTLILGIYFFEILISIQNKKFHQ